VARQVIFHTPDFFTENLTQDKNFTIFADRVVGLYFKKMNETKEKILTIALYYFLKKPYNEVTMSEILKASGLSKGGFYHHFESKEIMYHEVVDHFILGSFFTEYGHYTDKPYDLPFSDFIPFYIKSTLEHMIELADKKLNEVNLKIENVNLYVILFDMMKHYKGFEKVMQKYHQSEISLFETVIEKSKERGEIKQEIDTHLLAKHIHTLMHGMSVLGLLEEDMANIEDNIKEEFGNFYQLIKT